MSIKLDSRYTPHVASYQKLSETEYIFFIINFPGSPWKLKIKAEKSSGKTTCIGKSSLLIKRNGRNFEAPSSSYDIAQHCIIQTLNIFLLPGIIEIKINGDY